jgi:hypothetical protein
MNTCLLLPSSKSREAMRAGVGEKGEIRGEDSCRDESRVGWREDEASAVTSTGGVGECG